MPSWRGHRQLCHFTCTYTFILSRHFPKRRHEFCWWQLIDSNFLQHLRKPRCISFIYLCIKLISWRTVHHEKLIVPYLVKTFPVLYGTWTFIAAFTRARHLALSWARSIPSTPSHRVSWRSIFISCIEQRHNWEVVPLFPPVCLYVSCPKLLNDFRWNLVLWGLF